jgi:hypothetical protein
MSARDSLEQLLQPRMLKVLVPIGIIIFGGGTSFALWSTTHPSTPAVERIAAEAATAAVNEHDHGNPKPLPTPAYPPPRGIVAELEEHDGEIAKLRAEVAAARMDTGTLRQFVVDQYRWRVRWQAAEYETDRRKRKMAADHAEDRFDRLLAGGADPDEALRRVLETDPRSLR